MSGNEVPIGEDDLDAFVDGRLPDARRERVEHYLAEHPDLRERVSVDRRHRDELRARLAAKFSEPIPLRLRIAGLRAARRAGWQRRMRIAAAAIAIFILGAASGWLAARIPSSAGGPAAVARNASAAYRTFVVEVAHPVEVDAAHEEHLLRWLSKRLGRKLVAPNLAKFGFRLIGGRLLPASAGAAAQLMYETVAGKRLTVYVQAVAAGETAFRFRQDGAAATFAWIDRGFGFAVTAAAGRDELLPIAEAVYDGLDGGQGRQG